MNDRELAHLDHLLKGLALVEGWRARIDPDSPRPLPADGSPMKKDNERTEPHQLGHAAWHAISHAVDHLHCLRALIADAELLTMYAPYTLVRAALENASCAVWLLHPKLRAERITRLLQLRTTDVRSADRLALELGVRPPVPLDDRLAELKALARANQIDEKLAVPKPLLRYGDIVSRAGEVLGAGPPTVAVWRACSGIAHADLSATLAMTSRTVLPQSDPRAPTLAITINVEGLKIAASAAIAMTRRAWALHDQRMDAPY